jgi:hypothetical protein
MDKEKKYLLLNWILLTSYGCINLFAVFSCVYSWPTQGSIIWFLLIIFCPLFLYHVVFIAFVLMQKDRQQWVKKCRVVTLISGVLLAGGLLQLTQKISLIRFKNAYSPMIVKVAEKMPNPCGEDYFQIPQVQRYNQSVTQKILKNAKPAGELLYNVQRFVLYFRAGSVDRDNSSLFYDSTNKEWHFFHNDNALEAKNFSMRIKGLSRCSRF